MPDMKQVWTEAVNDCQRPNISKDKYLLKLYRLCQAQARFHLQRCYGGSFSAHDLEDVMENSISTFLERSRQAQPTPDPSVYFFSICFSKARSAQGKSTDNPDRQDSLERTFKKIGFLQDQEKNIDIVIELIESVGDLLRLGGSLEREQRFAFRILRFELLRLCCAQLVKWTKLLPVPNNEPPVTVRDVRWAIAERTFCARDQLESIRVALSHWSMENEFILQPTIETLEKELAKLDQRLGIFLPLESLALLGPRRVLISQFSPPAYLQLTLQPPTRLTEEVLAAFLCEGDHSALVQGLAEELSETRSLLQDFLEEARFVQMPRSLAARHLELSLASPMDEESIEEGLPIPLPRVPHSSALEAPLFSEEKEREVLLGKIPAHDAHLSLLSEIDSPVLRVYPGAQTLSRVSFGEQKEPRRTYQIWEVALGRWPKESEPIKITLQFGDGSEVEEVIRFTNITEEPNRSVSK